MDRIRILAALVLAPILSGCLGGPGAPVDPTDATQNPLHDPVCEAMVHGVDLYQSTVIDLQRALADGRITSVDLVQAALDRIEAFDDPQVPGGPGLNAVISLNPLALQQAQSRDAERAAGNPRGPLHGIPVLLKDNVGTHDQATTAGSIALVLNVPPEDSTLTARLREAGAIILGKTNLSEFAGWMSAQNPAGYSSLGGQTVSAYTGGNPRGSSSGSAVAASMAFAPLTIGTQTGNSIVAPSRFNGVVGMAPTTGLVSRSGIIPFAQNFDTPGPITQNVVDAAAMLSAIAGTDPSDPRTVDADANLPPDGDFVAPLADDGLQGVRLGYEPSTNEAFQAARADLESAGAVLVEIERSDEGVRGVLGLPVFPNEFKFGINRYLADEAGPGLPVSDLTDVILFNQDHPDEVRYGQDYLIASDATPGNGLVADSAAVPFIEAARAGADRLFAEYDIDAIIGPNTIAYTFAAEAGYPAVVVPMGFGGATPSALMIFGPMWADSQILSYAYAYEQVSQRRVPPEAVNPSLLDVACDGAA